MARDTELHKARVRARNQRIAKENRERLWDHLRASGCVDCGEADPRVLEFDHVRGVKRMAISSMIYHAWVSIASELEKCEVRCANCHRRVTGKARGWWINMGA